GADAGHLGGARFLPRLRPRRARPRRRAQPRPRGALARSVALGASRRGCPRQRTADRLLRRRDIGTTAGASLLSLDVALAAGTDVRLVERRLRRGQARQRDAERRAADVVQAELVAERDRARLAAVLAADAQLHVRLRGSP